MMETHFSLYHLVFYEIRIKYFSEVTRFCMIFCFSNTVIFNPGTLAIDYILAIDLASNTLARFIEIDSYHR